MKLTPRHLERLNHGQNQVDVPGPPPATPIGRFMRKYVPSSPHQQSLHPNTPSAVIVPSGAAQYSPVHEVGSSDVTA